MKIKLSHPEILGVICAMVVLISPFLVWFTMTNFDLQMENSVNYISGDGLFLVLFSILVFITIYIFNVRNLKNKNIYSGLAMIVASVIPLYIVYNDASQMDKLIYEFKLADVLQNNHFAYSYGIGFYVGILSLIGLLFAGIWSLLQKKSKESILPPVINP